MKHSKMQAAGKQKRRALIESVWADEIDRLRMGFKGQGYAIDDLHDALAALWSIRRWQNRTARVLGNSARDSEGWPMRIVA